MPLYEYKCKNCEKTFEVIEGFEGGTSECIYCASPEIKKVIHAPMVVFKGSGFYETEYGRQKHHKQKEEDREKLDQTARKSSETTPDDSNTAKDSPSSGGTKGDSKPDQ
jgi:putative FmdB family regulatory protein